MQNIASFNLPQTLRLGRILYATLQKFWSGKIRASAKNYYNSAQVNARTCFAVNHLTAR